MAGKRRADGPAVKKPAARTPAAAPGRARLKWFAKWAAIAMLVLGLLGATTVVVLYRAIDVPDPNAEFQMETTSVYYADGENEVGQFAADQNRRTISFEDMPETIKDAVIAAEDRSFWTNNGIDVKGILRAAFSNIRGNSTQGASTITQQYVKVLYLTQERSYKRKVKEAIIARKLAGELGKEQILAGYLNTIYFGRGAYGIDVAARTFFAKEAKDLTLRESAVLASVINNPTQFDPANGPENRRALKARYEYVLKGMNEMGKISSAQYSQAVKRLPAFPKVKALASYGGQRGHALELIKQEALRTGAVTEDQIIGGGLKIYTTLTRNAMSAAEQGVMEVRPKGLPGLHTAVASVEPGTGALRGFFGGQDYLDSQINWAVSGGQPGSTFKPFALAAGLESGFSLKDTFEGNAPLVLGDGLEISNVGEGLAEDQGAKIDLIKATMKSVNTAYVDLTLALPDGPDDVVDMATRLGIPRWNKKLSGLNRLRNSPGLAPDATVALGSASVSPINMANAYATIANGGERASVYVIEKIEDRSGEVLYRHKVRTKRVLEEDIAADVSYALQQTVSGSGGTAHAATAIGRPAAAKTGTATAGEDEHVSSSWFVGYTPQMATAVMYVRGDGQESLEDYLVPYFGGTYPGQTWAAVMERIMEGQPVEEFPEPAFVDGEAPTEGHAPYTPPPPPTKTSTPKPTQTTAEPEPTETVPTQTLPTVTLPTEDPTTDEPGPCDNPLPPPSCEPTDPGTEETDTVEEEQKPRVEGYREDYAVR